MRDGKPILATLILLGGAVGFAAEPGHPIELVAGRAEKACGTGPTWSRVVTSALALGEALLTEAIGSAPGAVTVEVVEGRVPRDNLPVFFRADAKVLGCIAMTTQRRPAGTLVSSVLSAATCGEARKGLPQRVFSQAVQLQIDCGGSTAAMVFAPPPAKRLGKDEGTLGSFDVWLTIHFDAQPRIVGGCFKNWESRKRELLVFLESAAEVQSWCSPLYIESSSGSWTPWFLGTSIEERRRQLGLKD